MKRKYLYVKYSALMWFTMWFGSANTFAYYCKLVNEYHNDEDIA